MYHRSLGVLALLCSPLIALAGCQSDGPTTIIVRTGFGTAVIDGVIGGPEWSAART